MNHSDQTILERIRTGDEAAFETLFRTHYAALVGFARKFVGDQDDAEELVQELFTKLWEGRQKLQLSAGWRPYLFRAAKNACLNYLKHQKVRELYQKENQDSAAATLETEQRLDQEELRARINAAVRQLPDRCRQAFELSRYEGLKYAEIAEHMGISPRTVEVQIGKALKLLREELKDLVPLVLLLILTGPEIF